MNEDTVDELPSSSSSIISLSPGSNMLTRPPGAAEAGGEDKANGVDGIELVTEDDESGDNTNGRGSDKMGTDEDDEAD